ncbi:hypothetical protein ASPWEDRAFT_40933 [Aspergillus wentii DTO 134E9]|uniref:Uncharacterized protein n=1 Tax=Aspergillus wentii DTO 134E9 TaxID=1073089 RepID=A0A1L9RLA3_ASPWE|nr:uncharacterized protein ASPWEDRAFT_40933 [Aspergillus wentii DTO 134E9]OJJ35701.1 hypothetical protein ASPWEDRAFT_40933 [Aspergillus wentii DTO 134E9]
MPKLAVVHSPPCAIRTLLHTSPSPKCPIPRASHRQSFVSSPRRPLAQPRYEVLGDTWLPLATPTTFFSPTGSHASLNGLNGNPNNDHKPPDERILKLGKTLRTLSPLLPTLLVNPLPPNILSPSVTLHLFPATHPHLPTVRGRTLYRAALWTVPVAWSSLPLVGNVKLQILSERIVRAGTVLDPDRCSDSDCGDERLVIRWKTQGRSESHSETPVADTTPNGDASSGAHGHLSSSRNGINKGLSVLLGGDAPIFKLSKEEEFTGLFIFSFDEEGRISTHTIEHADDANGWDRTPKFVTLTDWLIGKARGSLDPSTNPELAFQSSQHFGLPQGEKYRHSHR